MSPGLNNKRMLHLMRAAVERCRLDLRGAVVLTEAASGAYVVTPVLAAMGVDADRSLRLSVGWSSVATDVDRFVEVFPGIVERLRGLRAP